MFTLLFPAEMDKMNYSNLILFPGSGERTSGQRTGVRYQKQIYERFLNNIKEVLKFTIKHFKNKLV